MPITREESFPAESAQLFQAFNRCAEDHSFETVLSAVLNFYGLAVGELSREHGLTLDQAKDYAGKLHEQVLVIIQENWNRKPKSTDVPVALS